MEPLNHLQSGLNISLSEDCASTAFNKAKESFHNRAGRWGSIAPIIDNHYCQVINTSDGLLAISSDGVGTKVEIAERCKRYDTLGFDLAAMIVDDLICVGAEPTHITNIIDVNYLDKNVIEKLMSGFKKACDESKVAITGGETAELGDRIKGYGSGMHFNWCASGFGIIPKGEKPLDGSNICAGDVIVALKSHGLRSNGYSLARQILKRSYGDKWHKEIFDKQNSWGNILLTPSKIYAPKILEINKEVPLKGIVHITGGGVSANLKRILKPWGLGAKVDDLHPPHKEMLKLQQLGKISERQAYEMWNMGNAMLLIIDSSLIKNTLDKCNTLEISAKVSGTITRGKEIEITSSQDPQNIIKWSIQ